MGKFQKMGNFQKMGAFRKTARFSAETQDYFQNLVGYNPTQLVFVRGELMKSFFRVNNPNHYLCIVGPSGSGKSLLINTAGNLLGPEAIFRITVNDINGQFPLAGISMDARWVSFDDLDETADVDKASSLVCEWSTQKTLYVRRKFENESRALTGVQYCMISNQFLPAITQGLALERRQVIVEPLEVPMNNRNVDMPIILRDNTAAISNWVTQFPHILFHLDPYSNVLNYMTRSDKFGWNTLFQFLMDELPNLYMHADDSYPMLSISDKDVGRYGPLDGLQVLYERRCTDTDQLNKMIPRNQFNDAVNYMGTQIFCTPVPPGKSQAVFRRRIPGTPGTDRVCWYRVWYTKTPSTTDLESGVLCPLSVKVPLRIAVLALLHPATSDDPFAEKNTYLPGLSIHVKFPHEWLGELFKWVQLGPDRLIKEQVLQNERRVRLVIDEIINNDRRQKEAIALAKQGQFESSQDRVVRLKAEQREKSETIEIGSSDQDTSVVAFPTTL